MRRLLDRYLRPVPAERLAALRLLVGAFALIYLVARLPTWLGLAGLAARDYQPVGLVWLLTEHPVDVTIHAAIVWATVALGVGFVAGAGHRVVAPLFAAGLLWLTSYRSSWGLPFHTENLLALHVIVLAVAPAADAWSIDAWRRARHRPPVVEVAGWPVRLMATLTVLTYLLAGIAKLRVGGLAWADGAALRDQVAVDNVRKVLLGSTMSPVATPFLRHPWLFEGMAIGSLIVELGAPLALVHRRIALVWSAAAWGFHVGVMALMAIVFPYPLALIAYAPLAVSERPVRWVIARWRRLRGPAPR